MSDYKEKRNSFLKQNRVTWNNKKLENFPADRKRCLEMTDKGSYYNQATWFEE